MKLIILFLLLAATAAYAQQDPLYASYMNNPFMVNPAYAGYHNAFSVSAGYRHQWDEFDGPKTLSFSADLSLRDNTAGAGVVLTSDRSGATTRTDFLAAYAYRLPINTRGAKLSFAMQGGLSNFRMDNGELSVHDAGDPLFQGSENVWIPNVGAGVIVSHDHYFFGLSVPRILEGGYNHDDVREIVVSRHYYFSAAYLFTLSERLALKPSAMVRFVSAAPLSVDMNATFVLDHKYGAALFTRNLKSYGMILQLLLQRNYRVGYVFEAPFGDNVDTRFVTHEVTIGLRTGLFRFHDDAGRIAF